MTELRITKRRYVDRISADVIRLSAMAEEARLFSRPKHQHLQREVTRNIATIT